MTPSEVGLHQQVQKSVVLCVCGGIAAYKSVELARRFMDAGYRVIPVMTDDAKRFVGEVTFSALCSEPVRSSLWSQSEPVPHTSLARRADLIVVAPATANIISKYANGASDDLVSAVLSAATSKVLLAPAMHTEMWENRSVQRNVSWLIDGGVDFVQPGVGRLAGGDYGAGRMAEPAEIFDVASRLLGTPTSGDQSTLAGIRVLITAGGTREPIDPVRYVGNRSSGRQGYAFAKYAAEQGAIVTLITSSELPVPPGVAVDKVETASQMFEAVKKHFDGSDIVVMAAAVADFAPARVADDKIKKADGVPEIRLVPTVDILEYLGSNRRPEQVVVGFAAETSRLEENVAIKRSKKHVDIMVGNDVTKKGAGFGVETNSVYILDGEVSGSYLDGVSKLEVARVVLTKADAIRRARQ